MEEVEAAAEDVVVVMVVEVVEAKDVAEAEDVVPINTTTKTNTVTVTEHAVIQVGSVRIQVPTTSGMPPSSTR